MALARRIRQDQNIWPGFVDALASLLMVLIFLLMIFVVSQLFLNDALIGRDRALGDLNAQLAELSETLHLEREENARLETRVVELSSQLSASLSRERETEAQLTEQMRLLAETRTALATEQEQVKQQVAQLADLAHQIKAMEALKAKLQKDLQDTQQTAESRARELKVSNQALTEAQSELALLNQQLEALQTQMAELNKLLATSEARDKESQAEIKSLGRRLNAALAGKVQELSRYRSEFFGRLRQILGDRRDIQIVKDRFVFQSEVLFESGSADLGTGGKRELMKLAKTLLQISEQIPTEIHWILQVEGHTDRLPISSEDYPSNWELSVARALSVVRFLEQEGIPAKRLAAAGYGEFQPLDEKNDEIAHRRNRRIELKLTQR